MTRLVIPLFLLATGLASGEGGGPVPDPVTEIRVEFERVRSELDKPTRAFQRRYEGELGKLRAKAQAAGNIELYLAVEEEAKSYAATPATIPDTFPELQGLRRQYDKVMRKLAHKKHEHLKQLLGAYRQQLMARQKELVQQDKVPEAVAVKTEITRVDAELRMVKKKLTENAPAPPKRIPVRKTLPADLIATPRAEFPPVTELAAGSREAQEEQKATVTKLGLPLEVKSKQTGIVLRLIPAGSFTMGSMAGEMGRKDNERQVSVNLSKPFYCGKFEVTQEQWKAVMGSNPSAFTFSGKKAPVETVSWEECQTFLQALCEKEGVPEGIYRLLTEAEWEYACRAGTTTPYYSGKDKNALDRIGWYEANSRDKTHSVGGKMANAFGLHDMSGNVWEWCSDWMGELSGGVDPSGPATGLRRVDRGGGWGGSGGTANYCRAAHRGEYLPMKRSKTLGLRLMRTVP